MGEEYEPPKRPNSKLAKLAKILGMAAAREAEKLRRQMDIQWDKLLGVAWG
jgi:hypothetical protein